MKTLLFWLIVIFVLSVYPFERPASSFLFSQEDKFLHFMIYAITVPLVYVVLRQSGAAFLKKIPPLLIAVVFTLAYGLLMELTQEITTSRSFSVSDALANALGAGAGVIYILVVRMRGAGKS
jgi:VanZ family protein